VQKSSAIVYIAVGLSCQFCAGPLLAQESEPIEQMIVTGVRASSLNSRDETGSRLGLTLQETPATVFTMDSSEILGLGLHTIEEATQSLPGVLAGFPPGDMGNFSMRGFSGNQVTLLYNGDYFGPSMMVARPGSSFNVQQVEVVKGPAAVVHGNGAIGGAINIITKEASFEQSGILAEASYGRFDTYDLGVDASGQVNDRLALRAVVSQTGSGGYVKGDTSRTFDATVSALWRPVDNLRVLLTVDYLKDKPSHYFGTPYVPATVASDPLNVIEPGTGVAIDRAMRYVNYNNLTDTRIKSNQWTPTLTLDWTPSDTLKIENKAFYINAQRSWRDSEAYQYNDATGLIDRDRFFVIHDQELWGDRGTLTLKHDLGPLANNFVAGFEYSHLDFVHTRGFPDGDSVDRFDPAPAPFGPMVGRVSPTKWDAYALFAEDSLSLTSKLKLIGGIRSDWLDLNRANYNFDGSFNADTSFKRNFEALSGRVGVVYDILDTVSAYASYSTGKDLAGTSSSLFLINAAQGKTFALADAEQVEAGVKASTADRRINATVAIYRIKRSNFLTQIDNEGDLSNIGSQTSKGVELSTDFRLTEQWSVSGDLAYTHARYGTFIDPDFGIAASGNTPANVAKWVGGARTSVKEIAGLPLEIGGGIRFVSSRYAATDNEVKLKPYNLVDTYVGYDVTPRVRLTARVKNLFNKAYVQWADVFYPTEVVLAPPRTYEIGLHARF
jgi:iron complex outermembrane receptor protein